MAIFRLCSIPDCGKVVLHLGLCGAHYHRQRNHGDPLAGGTPKGELLRFYREVVLAHDSDDCLVWPFGRDRDGYGRFRLGHITHYVHRLVCGDVHGAPPSPKHQAAHSCGNAGCCAPTHIRWSTPRENELDKVDHGTSNRGSRHGNAKLTDEQVLEIKALLGTTSQSAIGRLFGVSQGTVHLIARGKIWSWL